MSATIRQNLDLPGKAFGLSSTYVALGVMVLLWGSSWPVTKLALQSVPPLWLATVRFASAAVCLCLYLALRGQLRLPTRQDLPIIASVGLLQMMTFTGLGMVAMVQIDTSRAVLLAYTTPLWCVLVAWLLLRQAPSRQQLTGLSIGMAGVVAVCSPAELDWTQPGTVKGALFLLLAAVSWALVGTATRPAAIAPKKTKGNSARLPMRRRTRSPFVRPRASRPDATARTTSSTWAKVHRDASPSPWSTTRASRSGARCAGSAVQ